MNKRNQPENKLVVEPILKKLKHYQLSGDIVWYRENKAEEDRKTEAGTPDIFVIVNCKDSRTANLFIECKQPTDKRPTWDDLRFEQRVFFEDMAGAPMTLCAIVNNPKQLWPLIKKCQNL